jgi:tetratricopeptide (TPR) repeat protein
MRRLADYLCDFTARAGEGLGHGEGRMWVRRIDEDVDTLRAAVAWGVDHDDAGLAVRLTAPLTRYWWNRGLLGQMLDLADTVAALPSASALPPHEEALLLWTRGTIRVALGRTAEAVPLLEELVPAARATGQDRLLAQALFSLAQTKPAPEGDQPEELRELLEESVRRFRAAGDDWGVALALIPLGDLALLAGDLQGARGMHEEVLRHATAIGDDHMTAQAYDQLAFDALLASDLAGARTELCRAAALHRGLHDREGTAYTLEGFAALAVTMQQPELAARLMGAADHARRLVGVVVWPFVRPLLARLQTFVRASTPGYDAAFAEGALLEPEQALDLAVRSTATT